MLRPEGARFGGLQRLWAARSYRPLACTRRPNPGLAPRAVSGRAFGAQTGVTIWVDRGVPASVSWLGFPPPAFRSKRSMTSSRWRHADTGKGRDPAKRTVSKRQDSRSGDMVERQETRIQRKDTRRKRGETLRIFREARPPFDDPRRVFSETLRPFQDTLRPPPECGVSLKSRHFRSAESPRLVV
jgi:hypothetical protein